MLSQSPYHQPTPRPRLTPDQDLVLQIPYLNESFETSQADLGIRGDGQGVAHGAGGGQLCPDAGCGCQVPKSQSPGQTPRDQALLIRKQLAGEDTVLMVLQKRFTFSYRFLEAQAPSLLTVTSGFPKAF